VKRTGLSSPGSEPHRRGRGMTAKEAAAYCGVTVATLASWRQRSSIGPKFSARLGRDPRYHIDDLDAFLWGDQVVTNSVEAKHQRAGRKAGRETPMD